MNKIECIRYNINKIKDAIRLYDNCSFNIYDIFTSEERLNSLIRGCIMNIVTKCGFSREGLDNIPIGEEARYFSRIDLDKLKVMENSVKEQCENIKFISFEEFKNK